MKLVKSLLLGSAAGLIAVGGAQAADLPVKAKAVRRRRSSRGFCARFDPVFGRAKGKTQPLNGCVAIQVANGTKTEYRAETLA